MLSLQKGGLWDEAQRNKGNVNASKIQGVWNIFAG